MSTQAIYLTDSIYIRRAPDPDRISKDKPPRHLLIYLIPGNPGLVEYYDDFLTHLASLLDPNVTNYIYHVVGHSLGGFEVGGNVGGALQLQAMVTGQRLRSRTGGSRNWGLDRQQRFVFESLRQTVEVLQRKELGVDDVPPDVEPFLVMMVGHSVGAYILMQNLAWRHKTQIKLSKDDGALRDAALDQLRQDEGLGAKEPQVDDSMEIVGGVGLFPTIVDLAGSPRGRKLAPFAKRAWLATIMQLFAYTLWLVPGVLVAKLVKNVLRHPPKAADTTAAFLRSNRGVYSALFMARHELSSITTNKWHAYVWNKRPVTRDEIDRPQLYFFWGDNDYWVENSARDKIIADHARKTGQAVPDDRGRPYMEIDNSGIPHDFCIQPGHSKRVAEKVSRFVLNMLAYLRKDTDSPNDSDA